MGGRMSRDPFEQPDDVLPRADHDAASCRRHDCADCIVAELDVTSERTDEKPDDTVPDPCTRRGCRGCDKSPPVAGNEPPF